MQNKVCVITGGSSGIGEATVLLALKKGYRVYNLDRQPSSRHGCFTSCDVTQGKVVNKALSDIIGVEKKIDSLVISAGIHLSANIEATSEQDFDNIMDVNAKGAYLVLKAALPWMKLNNGGSIVIVASDQAFVGKKNSFVYNASKAAVAAMARTVALDYAGFGIRCNAVCPGTIDTPLYRRAIEKYAIRNNMNIDDLHKDEANEQPVGRLGSSQEVAEFILFLLNETSSFITGALLPVDGGYTAK